MDTKSRYQEFGQEFQWFGETKRYSSLNSQSGFQFNKYMETYRYSAPVGTTINPNGNNPTTIADVPLMRYAEILLMKAEALLMQGEMAMLKLIKLGIVPNYLLLQVQRWII